MWDRNVERDFLDGYDSDFSSLEEVKEAMRNCDVDFLSDKNRYRNIFHRELMRFIKDESEVQELLNEWDETCLATEELDPNESDL